MPKLGEILEQVSRSETVDLMKEYHLLGIRLEGGGAFHRETKLGSQVSANIFFKVKSGDFIYSRLFAWRGAFDVVDNSLDSFYVSNEFPTFIHKQDRVDTEFLRLWFRLPGTIARVEALCSGSTPLTRNRLKEDKFLNLEIPLPPLEEQRRIVARVEELAAKIEEARGLRREAVEEGNRLLSNTITQSLTEIKHQSREVTLASVATSVTDGDHQPPPKADRGIPFILISHITSGKLDLIDCRWVPEEYYSSISANRIPKRGDILYTAVGATYGTPCLVDTDNAFCFQRHIAIIKPDRKQINSEYLKWVLSSGDVYNQATHFVTGSAQPTVPLRGIRQLTFPLPSLEQQNVLATHFNALQAQVNSLKHYQSQTSTELNALLPSILDKAFKGEL